MHRTAWTCLRPPHETRFSALTTVGFFAMLLSPATRSYHLVAFLPSRRVPTISSRSYHLVAFLPSRGVPTISSRSYHLVAILRSAFRTTRKPATLRDGGATLLLPPRGEMLPSFTAHDELSLAVQNFQQTADHSNYKELAEDLGLNSADVREALEKYFIANQEWLSQRANHTKWNAGRVDRLRHHCGQTWLACVWSLFRTLACERKMGNTNYKELAEARCVDRTVSPKLGDCAVRSVIRLFSELCYYAAPCQAAVVLEHYFLDHEQWLCDRANHTKWNPVRVDRLVATKTITTDEWLKKAVELGDNGVETPLRTDIAVTIGPWVLSGTVCTGNRALFSELWCVPSNIA
ncbi:hypothetical protein FN846DRAFT_989374 [Sphaerosporella brunnea]|uniref:Uncharacterized protein n=1 Tax=Sphaerosporella brunnea TaxID=1250544 RepID=A0A5J5EPW6_9PEZI|nr:hypothetical protein FN846DRAFT_989374 [Sphaerosporella brunnea]